MNRYGKAGWFMDSHRHYLAAKFGSAPKRYMALSNLPNDREAMIRALMKAEGISRYEAEIAADETAAKNKIGSFVVQPKKKEVPVKQVQLEQKFSQWKQQKAARVVPTAPVQAAPVTPPKPDSKFGIRVRIVEPEEQYKYITIHPNVIQELREQLGEKVVFGYSPPSVREKVYALQRKLGMPQSDELNVGEVLQRVQKLSKGDAENMIDEMEVAIPAVANEIRKDLGTMNYKVVLNPVTGEKEYRLTSQQPEAAGKLGKLQAVEYEPDYTGQAAMDEYRRTYNQLEQLRKGGPFVGQDADRLKTKLQLKLIKLENNMKIAGKDTAAFAKSFPTQFPKTAAVGAELGTIAKEVSMSAAQKAKIAAAKVKEEAAAAREFVKRKAAEPYTEYEVGNLQRQERHIEQLQAQREALRRGMADQNTAQAYDTARKLLKIDREISAKSAKLEETGGKVQRFTETYLPEGEDLRSRLEYVQSAQRQARREADIERAKASYARQVAVQQGVLNRVSPSAQEVLRAAFDRNVVAPPPVNVPGYRPPTPQARRSNLGASIQEDLARQGQNVAYLPSNIGNKRFAS